MRQLTALSFAATFALGLMTDVQAEPASAKKAPAPTGAAKATPSATTPPPLPTAAASATPPLPPGMPRPWKEMDARQRTRYMKSVVSPQMKVAFQEFDPVAFKTFNCATCHGKDPEDRKYKMPSPDIHPLPPTPAAFQAMLKQKPEWPRWTKFMAETVVPRVGGLLGQPIFDPKKPQAGGFSCEACHTMSKK